MWMTWGYWQERVDIGDMFARTKTFKNKDGSTRTYLQVVENVRENGRVRQHLVANLGRRRSPSTRLPDPRWTCRETCPVRQSGRCTRCQAQVGRLTDG